LGALVAFTFVNLSVINQFFLREKCNKTWRDRLHYLLLPLLGAITVAILWWNLERDSMIMGLIWAGLGFIYLLYLTRLFRQPPKLGN